MVGNNKKGTTAIAEIDTRVIKLLVRILKEDESKLLIEWFFT